MIFSINKQAVEIKTRFEKAPLTSPNEACAAMGMLYKIYGLSVPQKRDTVSQMKEDFHAAVKDLPVPSEFAAKIITLLDDYYNCLLYTSPSPRDCS